jgi:hypothetical protein
VRPTLRSRAILASIMTLVLQLLPIVPSSQALASHQSPCLNSTVYTTFLGKTAIRVLSKVRGRTSTDSTWDTVLRRGLPRTIATGERLHGYPSRVRHQWTQHCPNG